MSCASRRSGKGLVFGDDDGARIFGVAIVPAEELEAEVGRGLNLDGVAIIIGATAGHNAPGGIVGDNLDGVLEPAE